MVCNKINLAKQELKDIQWWAKDIREVFLQERVAFYAELQHKKEAAILNNIISVEMTKKIFHKLWYALAPCDHTHLKRIIIPKQDEPDIIIIDGAEEMYNTILMENQAILMSGAHMPPVSATMWKYLGDCGDAYGVEEILNGNPLPREIQWQEYLNLLLEAMHSLETADVKSPLINDHLSFDKFKDVFLATWETTASSPSGIHVGHYQVGAHFP